ncbi:AAA family ATPase [Chloroherpeton thalassium]|nr:AAA family ATPase [Chloroherpeton thalassium]
MKTSHQEIIQEPRARFAFTETSVWRKFYEAARLCHLYGEIGRVTGPSGVGKTTAVNEYKRRDDSAIVIRAHHRYSTREVFVDLCEACHIEPKGTVHRMMRELVTKLHHSARLLILDEAEHLSPSTLDEVRQLNDRAGIGILYVGIDRFRSRLQSLRGDYEYIVNRVKVPASLRKLTLGDAASLCRTVIPELSDECVKLYHRESGGDGRFMENHVFKSLIAARHSSVPVGSEAFAEIIAQTADILLERGGRK